MNLALDELAWCDETRIGAAKGMDAPILSLHEARSNAGQMKRPATDAQQGFCVSGMNSGPIPKANVGSSPRQKRLASVMGFCEAVHASVRGECAVVKNAAILGRFIPAAMKNRLALAAASSPSVERLFLVDTSMRVE